MRTLLTRIGITLLAVLTLSGCSDKPKGTISERKMVKLMADMQLAEAYANTVGMNHYSQGDERSNMGKGVLEAHGVTQEQLDSTLAWYGRNLDDYTGLYEKVDKEINSRQKKIMRKTGVDEIVNSADILWPYVSHGVLSTLGNSDAWVLSLESPNLNQGDILEWTLRLSENAQINGVLGVEYDDGTSDAFAQLLTGNKKKYELRLQTDTAKIVNRIYGSLRLRDNSMKPIYADSIMLRKLPFDSLEYNKHRSLRHYGAPARIKPKVEKKDSVSDSGDSIKNEMTLEPGELPPTDDANYGEPVKMFHTKPIENRSNRPARQRRTITR